MPYKKLSLAFFAFVFLFASTAQAAAVFTASLKLGSKGAEVKLLQQYLNTNGFPIAESGPGSLGHETTSFGQMTKDALIKFQEKYANDILKPYGLTKGTGNFFAATRNFINKTLATPGTVSTAGNASSGYSVGGIVNGIAGPMTLTNNGETLTIAPGQVAQFTFSKKFKTGDAYSLIIAKAPAGQQCFMPTGITGAGVVGNVNVSIAIQCTSVGGSNPFAPMTLGGGGATTLFLLGGSVSGLLGNEVVLQTGSTTVTVTANGTFRFPLSLTAGSSYSVTVLTNPTGPDELCTVTNGTGVVNGDVANIQVSCVTTRTPQASINVSPTAVIDGDESLIYTVTLDQPVTSSTSVNFSISGTAVPGIDYTTVIGPVVIPAGQTTGIITLPTLPQTTITENRTVVVTLRTGTGYTIASPSLASASIISNNTQGSRRLFIEFDGGEYQFSADDDCNCLVLNPMGPMTLVNMDTSTPINVIFTGTWPVIMNNNMYILAGSDNIRFGSQTLDADGSPFTVTVHNVSNYEGFIGNPSGHTDISIMNLFVKKTGTSTLASSAGWILRRNSSNVTIINSTSNGNITTNGGGIAGANVSNVTILGSFSTGTIGPFAGGIVGDSARNITISNSYSTGAIGTQAGGILGHDACTSTTDCTIIISNSYSTGAIGAVNMYNAGGILGGNACLTATNCSVIITNSYSTGEIYGDDSGGNGGIVGSSADSVTVDRSHSTGTIGTAGGGIFSLSANNSTVTNSYSTGAIGTQAGGIFGPAASNSSVTNSYSRGNIAEHGGGIFSMFSDNSTVTNSYSTGNVVSEAGGIFGYAATNSSAISCYTTGIGPNGIFGSDGIGNTTTNCLAENSGIWSDVHAATVLTSASWTSPAANTPYVFAPVSASLVTPYSIVSANNDGSGNLSLNNGLSQVIEKGGATIAALSGYDTFSLVTINGDSPSNFPDISINAANGVISTTSNVAAGTYTIVVSYHQTFGNTGTTTSTYVLTVNN